METGEERRSSAVPFNALIRVGIAAPLQSPPPLLPNTQPTEQQGEQNGLESENSWLFESVGDSDSEHSNGDAEVIVLSSDDDSSIRQSHSPNGDNDLAPLSSSSSTSSYRPARPIRPRSPFGSPLRRSPPLCSPVLLSTYQRSVSPAYSLASPDQLSASLDYSATSPDYPQASPEYSQASPYLSHSFHSPSSSFGWLDDVSDGDGWSVESEGSLRLGTAENAQQNDGIASPSSSLWCAYEGQQAVVSHSSARVAEEGQRTSASYVSNSNSTPSMARYNQTAQYIRTLKRGFDPSLLDSSARAPKRSKFS
ncbi:unnamed protein product [Toxocara canis]|uniref:Uncharacterized protein n=1 Tax=Toxocara canis TaxID=6265 RepID=A0A183US85_TOXCA|nr:unnamed protein product [Toxocara canis]